MKFKLLFTFICLGFIGAIYSMSDADKMLIKGARSGDLKLVQEALAQNADINTADGNGYTALMEAVISSYEAMVKLLLASGVSLDLKNNKGKTALDLAKTAPIKLLIENEYKKGRQHHEANKMLFSGASNGDISLVLGAIQRNADINYKNKRGDTALIMAVIIKDSENIIKVLLENGADPDIQNDGDYTALMLAAVSNQEAIVKLLLEAGASLYLTNYRGQTALGIAKIVKHKSIEDLIKKEYEKREKLRQDVKKIVESEYLLPELAEIVSEYAVCPKEKQQTL